MTARGRQTMHQSDNGQLLSWSVAGIWNDSLDASRDAWELRPRERIWASELGMSFYDRWCKMKGIEATNPFDSRTLRKFQAGHLFEHLVGQVFQKAGLLVQAQAKRVVHLPGCFPVTVKPDYIFGGEPHWFEARQRIGTSELPEQMKQIAYALVTKLSDRWPKGIKPLVYEIKSVNSMVFWARKGQLEDAYPHHRMQLYMELHGFPEYGEGRLFYISKDDLTCVENGMSFPNPVMYAKVLEDCRTITDYVKRNVEPPTPESAVMDEKKGKLVPNWKVERSLYLTRMTGLSKDEWMSKTKEGCKEVNVKAGREKAKVTRQAKKEKVNA